MNRTAATTKTRPARKAGQGSKWIRPVKRLAIYARDGSACVYCGAGIEQGAILTLDHVVASDLGGGNEATNIVTCCLPCNSAKRALPLAEWLAVLLDRGINPADVAARVSAHTSRELGPYLATARQALADRE